MSSNESGDIKIQKKSPNVGPPGYDIVVSEKQGLEIAELINSPGWKAIKSVVIPQRKDIVARQALNSCMDTKQLMYFKGMVAELQLFAKALEAIKKRALKEDEETEDTKK